MKGEKSVSKNAVLNVIKRLCAVVFPMITFPYVSRILGAEIYGKVNFSSSIISYISLIAALGITNYAIRECSRIKDNEKAFQKKVNELFSINLTTTGISYVILILLLLFWPILKGYKALLLIQSLTIIATTVGTDWVNVVVEDYAYITIRYIVCQIIAVLSMFILVKNTDDYLLYAAVGISSSVLANISNFFYIRNHLGIKIRFTLHMNLKKHYKPLLVMFGGAIASLVYINSDITILGIMEGELEVGYYSVSAKIYTLVKQVVNAAMDVLLPRISGEVLKGSKEHLTQKFQNVINLLLVFIGPACVGLFLLSSNIVMLFSGPQYLPSSSSLKLLAVSLPFATFACFYINVVMIPYGMEKKILFATALSATVNIVLNIVFIPYWGQNATAFTTLLAEILMLSCGIYFTRNKIDVNVRKGLESSIVEMVGTAVICIACIHFISTSFWQIIGSVLLSCIYCGAIVLILFKNEWKETEKV